MLYSSTDAMFTLSRQPNVKQEFRLERRPHRDAYSPRGHGESGSGCRRARPTPPRPKKKRRRTHDTRARGGSRSRLPNLHAASYTPQKENPPETNGKSNLLRFPNPPVSRFHADQITNLSSSQQPAGVVASTPEV